MPPVKAVTLARTLATGIFWLVGGGSVGGGGGGHCQRMAIGKWSTAHRQTVHAILLLVLLLQHVE